MTTTMMRMALMMIYTGGILSITTTTRKMITYGTHVAGLAAAVSDNEIGIAGASWYAKIMPIKVFQSSGRGDATQLCRKALSMRTRTGRRY